MGDLNSNATIIHLPSLKLSLNQSWYEVIAKESTYIKGCLIGHVRLSKELQSSDQPTVLKFVPFYNMNLDAVFSNLETAG